LGKIINLYDEELPKVGKAAFIMNELWKETARHIDLRNHKESSQKITEWHKRAIGEFEKAGFVVEVDMTPIYMDMPPTISIVDRVNRVIFDHEKKSYEVKKSRNKGGK
jgi:hypothetical protein